MKLSWQMKRVLRQLLDGKPADDHCENRSDHGGLRGTLFALKHRGLIDGSGELTEAGRKAAKLEI